MHAVLPGFPWSPAIEAANDPGPQWGNSEALCLACRHRWQHVAPIGTPPNEVECPACCAHKGAFTRFFASKPGTSEWRCRSCDGWLFSIVLDTEGTPGGLCAGCGLLSNLLDCFPPPG